MCYSRPTVGCALKMAYHLQEEDGSRGAIEKVTLIDPQEASERVVIVPVASKFGWIKGVLVSVKRLFISVADLWLTLLSFSRRCWFTLLGAMSSEHLGCYALSAVVVGRRTGRNRIWHSHYSAVYGCNNNHNVINVSHLYQW